MRQFAATLRRKPAPLAGAFLALAAAAMIVTWTFSLGATALTRHVAAPRLAAASIVVTGDSTVAFGSGPAHSHDSDRVHLQAYRPVPAGLASRIAAVPGVSEAVADRSIPVAIRTAAGRTVTGTTDKQITGHGWSSAELTPFRLTSGHPPEGPGQIVLGADLARVAGVRIGDRVSLSGRALPPMTVVGLAAAPAGNRAGEWTAFFNDTTAASLDGAPAEADLIGIETRPGVQPQAVADQLRRSVVPEGTKVLTGSARGLAEDPTSEAELSNLSALVTGGGIDLVLVSLFVVASAVALSVSERARTLALLRAVGATPGQVRRMVMAELAGLGILAGLAGYLPGTWFASFSLRGLAHHQLVPLSTRAWTGWWEIFVAAGAGMVVAELAGWFAARRASRARPAAALVEAAVERRRPRLLRLLLGTAGLGGGVALTVMAVKEGDPTKQLSDAQLALLALLCGLALLGPYLMSGAELLLRWPLRLAGAPGRLASAQIRSRPRRMAAALVAIALPVTFIGAVSVVDSTQQHASIRQGRERLAASAVVTAPGPGLDRSIVGAVHAQPGAGPVVGLTPTTVYLPDQGNESTTAEAVTPGPLGSLLRLDVRAGSLSGFGPGDIALSRTVAGALGVRAGQTVAAYLADGTPYPARVAAVYSRSLGFADAVVPASAGGGGHLGTSTVGEVLVGGDGSRSARALAAQMDGLAASYPGLEATTGTVANAEYEKQASQDSYINNMLLAIIALLAGMALVNILVVATLESRAELGLVRRVGASSRQLLATAAVQAGAVTAVGVGLGVAAGAGVTSAVCRAIAGSWRPYIPWAPTAAMLGSVVAVSVLAMVVPTVRAGQEAGS